MPSIREHQSGSITRMILMGDSGSGKTGSLASLAAAGYNLYILDMDNGVDVLANVLLDPKSPYPKEAADRVFYETATEEMKSVGGKRQPKTAKAWKRALDLLSSWPDKGPLEKWTENDILVIDSITFLGKAALNMVLAMNARLGGHPQLQDWGQAQDMLESVIMTAMDTSIKCNMIFISHVSYIGEENGPQRGFPTTLGKALSPRVGRCFNSVIMAKSSGSGANVKRKLVTQSTSMIELKNTAPLRIQPEYPLETGLAEIFKIYRENRTGSPPPTKLDIEAAAKMVLTEPDKGTTLATNQAS